MVSVGPNICEIFNISENDPYLHSLSAISFLVSDIMCIWIHVDSSHVFASLIEKVMGIGGQALVTFIDYSKAFDSISHVQLFDIMLELGFPEHIVALLQSL